MPVEQRTRETSLLPDPWVPPWRPGLKQQVCASCPCRAIASTLDDSGRCAGCRAPKDPRAYFAVPEPAASPQAARVPAQAVLC